MGCGSKRLPENPWENSGPHHPSGVQDTCRPAWPDYSGSWGRGSPGNQKGFPSQSPDYQFSLSLVGPPDCLPLARAPAPCLISWEE